MTKQRFLNWATAISVRISFCLLVLLFISVFSSQAMAQAGESSEWLPGLLEKETITLVITDSGLGGLSVVAESSDKFRQNPVFKEVDLVFVNALFSDQGGYNSLQTRGEKLKVFSSALQSMQDRYAPDVILVACNTLSVLIPDTEFARTSNVPVVGIIEHGVEQIAAQLRDNPHGRNIIFATQTTVDEGTHKDQLMRLGIRDEQILAQSCPQLTLYIEQGYDSMYTEMLIDAYVDEALTGLGDTNGSLSVSFNCTHFGYSLDFWKKAFESRGIEVAAYLNPNTKMIDFLLPEMLNDRYPQSSIDHKVVSMIEIPEDRLDSIGRYLHSISPQTEAALREYELLPDLFKWRDLVHDPAQ
jgi:glutamate racemase